MVVDCEELLLELWYEAAMINPTKTGMRISGIKSLDHFTLTASPLFQAAGNETGNSQGYTCTDNSCKS